MANRSKRSAGNLSGLEFESLETRQLLAFDFLFDGTTLTLNQIADDGIVTIDNAAAGDAFRVADGAGLVTYEAATHVEVNLLDNSNHLSFALENPHDGDVTISAGHGSRSILFVGSNNEIGGDLQITSGDDGQFVSPSHVQDLVVGGSISVETGEGNDELRFANHVHTGTDLAASNALTVDFQTSFDIGGNLMVTHSHDLGFASLEKTSATPSFVGGDLYYEGNSRTDLIDLANIEITGDLLADLHNGFVIGVHDQLVALDQVEMENFIMTSGDTNNADVVVWSSVVVNSDIDINAGTGTNNISLHGTNHGGQVDYVGEDGVDHFIWSMSGPGSQNLDIQLGAGVDIFEMFDGSSIGNLGVDFGGTENHFLNHWGNFTFDAQLNRMDFFNVDYELATDTMTLTEINNVLVGDLDVFTDNVTNRVRVSTGDISETENLNVNLMDGSVRNLNLHLDHELFGSLGVDMGSGDKELRLDGFTNFIHGDVNIVGSDGDQTVYPSELFNFHASGDFRVDLGAGLDLLFLGTQVFDINGSVVTTDVNAFGSFGTTAISGDLSFDISGDTDGLSFFDNGIFVLAGDLTLIGNDFGEVLQFQSPVGSVVAGNLTLELANNDMGTQGLYLGPHADIHGNVHVTSSSNVGDDLLITDVGSEIGGDIVVELGDGFNSFALQHANVGGELVRYVGGSGVDEIQMDVTGMPAKYNFMLGEGDDGFVLLNSSTVGEFLRVDFGGGSFDQFFNTAGNWTFDTRILNYRGFNHFFDPVTSNFNMVQVADFGDVHLEYDAAGTILVDSGGLTNFMTTADHLQLQMMDNSSGDVEIELNSQLPGGLILNMRHGDRDAFFTGANNAMVESLRIVAGDGEQNIHLSENHNFSTKGDAVINLRDGSDSIVDNGHEIIVANNLLLRNVDTFEVKNFLDVGGNMSMVSHWYTQNTLFDNDGMIEIEGTFTYLGSDGSDDLNLTGNVLIKDDAYIQLGDNVTSGLGQAVDLSGGFQSNERLTIQGGTSLGGNHVISDEFARVGGDLIIDFTGSTSVNTAILMGQYGGNYGTFRGGSAADVLDFDAIAGDMQWATLMFGEDDEVHLGTATDVAFKYIDFGFGSDLFEDDHIEIFPMNVVNLP